MYMMDETIRRNIYLTQQTLRLRKFDLQLPFTLYQSSELPDKN